MSGPGFKGLSLSPKHELGTLLDKGVLGSWDAPNALDPKPQTRTCLLKRPNSEAASLYFHNSLGPINPKALILRATVAGVLRRISLVETIVWGTALLYNIFSTPMNPQVNP